MVLASLSQIWGYADPAANPEIGPVFPWKVTWLWESVARMRLKSSLYSGIVERKSVNLPYSKSLMFLSPGCGPPEQAMPAAITIIEARNEAEHRNPCRVNFPGPEKLFIRFIISKCAAGARRSTARATSARRRPWPRGVRPAFRFLLRPRRSLEPFSPRDAF